MTEDLVERLREDARGGKAYHELSDEAADEIERLRAAVDRIIDGLEMAVFCDGHTRLQPCEPECHCVQHYDAVRELLR